LFSQTFGEIQTLYSSKYVKICIKKMEKWQGLNFCFRHIPKKVVFFSLICTLCLNCLARASKFKDLILLREGITKIIQWSALTLQKYWKIHSESLLRFLLVNIIVKLNKDGKIIISHEPEASQRKQSQFWSCKDQGYNFYWRHYSWNVVFFEQIAFSDSIHVGCHF
jgi:hypothetical protein